MAGSGYSKPVSFSLADALASRPAAAVIVVIASIHDFQGASVICFYRQVGKAVSTAPIMSLRQGGPLTAERYCINRINNHLTYLRFKLVAPPRCWTVFSDSVGDCPKSCQLLGNMPVAFSRIAIYCHISE